VLRAVKMKKTKAFVLRRNELYGVAVKQWNRNCATGELRVGCVEGEGWNVN